jgi:hypothetical protein
MTSMSAGEVAGSDQPVVRLRSPADVCEAVPFMVDFDPAMSLVVLSLRGERQRAGLVVRVDLPDDDDAGALAELVVSHLERDGASAAVVVAYADAADRSPDVTVNAVLDACRDHDIEVAEAIRVADRRWTSYQCHQACCPPGGTPLRDRLTEPSACSTAMTLEGRQVLASRAVLEASIEPVGGLLATAMRARLEVEVDRFLGSVRGGRQGGYADATVVLVRDWVGRLTRGDPLTVDAAARMLAGLLDREVRDRCLGGGMGRLVAANEPPLDGGALELWRELVRRAVLPGLAAPVATLLAACAYLDHGNGALANVALDRALEDEPSYVMAQHLRVLLDGGIAPSTLRQRLGKPQ